MFFTYFIGSTDRQHTIMSAGKHKFRVKSSINNDTLKPYQTFESDQKSEQLLKKYKLKLTPFLNR